MNKFQNEDFKSEAELTGNSGVKSQLLNDTKIYVTANGLNKRLDEAIVAGDIGGGTGGEGSADTIFSDTANTASLGSYTQTGLILSTINPIRGSKSFSLIHQPATSQSFKRSFPIDMKFRGLTIQASLVVRSTASNGNLTVKFKDETNVVDLTASQQIQTDSQGLTLTLANGTPTLSGFTNASINQIKIGMAVTGPNIPANTIITGINATALTATMSASASASGSTSLRFSSLPAKRFFGIAVPANCSSISYEIIALQETNAETYIDDIIFDLTFDGVANLGQANYSIEVPIETEWVTASFSTLAWQGLGTVTPNSLVCRRNGVFLEMRGKLTLGVTTGSVAQLMLPNNYGSILCGNDNSSSGLILREQAATSVIQNALNANGFGYFWISGAMAVGSNPGTASTGGNFSTNDVVEYSNIRIPIQGWKATETKTFTAQQLVPTKVLNGNFSVDIPDAAKVIVIATNTTAQSITHDTDVKATFDSANFTTLTGITFDDANDKLIITKAGKYQFKFSWRREDATADASVVRQLISKIYKNGSVVERSGYVSGVATNANYNAGGVGGKHPDVVAIVTLDLVVNDYIEFYAYQSNGSGNTYNTSSKKIEAIYFPETVTTKTYSPAQNLLTQIQDSYFRINGFALAYGSTATRVFTFVSGTIQQNIGNAIQYADDAVNGAKFTALQEGVYTFAFSGDFPSAEALGFSINSNNVTTNYASLPANERVIANYDIGGAIATATVSIYLKVGDFIRPVTQGATAASTSGWNVFSVSFAGSIKLLNPSSDQKIEIPTHELRFYQTNGRGSGISTVIFNSIEKTIGDGFQVNTDATNGTLVTIKKDGLLLISTSVIASTTNRTLQINKNGNGGFIYPFIAETSLSASAGELFCSGIIKVVSGDVIRVVTDSVLSGVQSGQLSLVLQEQKIAVSVSNTLPQFSDSDSSIKLRTLNGRGSTNTGIARFSDLLDNIGTDITYTDSVTLGAYFTINKSGIYSISYCDMSDSVGAAIGITKNATVLTGNVNQNGNNILAWVNTPPSAQYTVEASWTGYLNVGDIVRAHTYTANSNPSAANFTITKIGKPNVTGIDVTPFANIKTQDTEVIWAQAKTPIDTTADLRFLVSDISTTNKGILRVEDDPTNTRTKFTAVKKCLVNISASNTGNVNGHFLAIYKNNSIIIRGSETSLVGYRTFVGGDLILEAGDFITLNSVSTSGICDFTITAVADIDAVVAPNTSFSTDTALLVYSNSYTASTLKDAPIGTFITFTYGASSNTRTQTSTAPAQSTSDMNINGILITPKVYGAADSPNIPASFAIQIGKGHKGYFPKAFKTTGKTMTAHLDHVVSGSAEYGFSFYEYDPTTGIVTIDAAFALAANTGRGLIFDDASSGSSCYFVIDAGKTPALAGVPQVQPRIATLSEVQPSGTNGGTFTAGSYITRTLNTLVDPTGIITSLVSNQFILPAGEYYIEGYATTSMTGGSKAKLRNITDGTDAIIGTSCYTAPVSNVTQNIPVIGNLKINSSKTFELQHRCGTTRATDGLGVAMGFGDNEVFSVVKITKIK